MVYSTNEQALAFNQVIPWEDQVKAMVIESCIVYTPPSYDEQTNQKFPVLYLQHGHGENELGWITAGRVNFILDNLIAERKTVPFIVVMSNGMVQIKDKVGEQIVDYKLFEKQLISDVIPFIEGKFRVRKEKTMRAMAGLSMGSLQTSLTAFNNPEYFSYLGVFSGFMTDIIQGSILDMVKRGNSTNEHLKILDDKKAFQKEFKVFFRAIGDNDLFMSQFLIDDKLCEEKQIEHIRKLYTGIHDWNVWRQCIRDFSQLIFK